MDRRNRPTVLTDAPEHRVTARFEVRDDDKDSDEITLAGYASTFEPYEMYGGPSRYGWIEQLDPHAFDQTLKENPDLHLLVNHEGMPLARTKSGTLKLSVDSKGLKVEAKLDRADPDVQRLEAKMRRGDMDEMSFAFRVKAQKWESAPGFEDDNQSLRTLLEVSLHKGDVSVVNFGANPDTSAEIKGFDQAIAFLAGLDPSELMAEARGLDDGLLVRAKHNLDELVTGPKESERSGGMSLHEALKEQGLAGETRLTLAQAEALLD